MITRIIYWVVGLTFILFFYNFDYQNCSAMEGGRKMQISSPAFMEGGMMPPNYSCDGRDISPPLEWKDIPAGTKSLALISDDPDAPMGTWVHWVVYDIPANTTSLNEDVKPEKEFKNGMRQGNNNWPKIGYGGPCPPSGTHRYFFRLYALDRILDLKSGATKAQLLEAMQGHVLAEAQLMGKYKRQR
jgi:Raf kinase inhibitor-like YbhB/YbcL family protein